MTTKPIKNIFMEGAIPPEFIAQSIAHHQTKTAIGAHNIFMGQVRADEIEGKTVAEIQFSAQEEMANQVCHQIRETTFDKYSLSCMHIHHSLGIVKAGEICFFAFVSGAHRAVVFDALPHIVNEIKSQVPIFGKEIFNDDTHDWKVNR